MPLFLVGVFSMFINQQVFSLFILQKAWCLEQSKVPVYFYFCCHVQRLLAGGTYSVQNCGGGPYSSKYMYSIKCRGSKVLVA